MKTNIEISIESLLPEMQEKALGTMHVQIANSIGREPLPQADYLSEEDFEKIKKEKIADWWIQKLTQALQEQKNKIEMEYLMAFGEYVPLGGEDIEPKVMAKEVTEIWGAKSFDKGQDDLRGELRGIVQKNGVKLSILRGQDERQQVIKVSDILSILKEDTKKQHA